MNNDEKREFISEMFVLQAPHFPCTEEIIENYFKNLPKKLYKYKAFDEYLFEIIDTQKIYLSPASKLDDLFECNVVIDMSEVFDGNSGYLTKNATDLVINHILGFLNSDEKRDRAEQIYRSCLINGKFDNSRALDLMHEDDIFTQEERVTIINSFANYAPVLTSKSNQEDIGPIIRLASRPKESVGIFSMSSELNNDQLWDKYADKYNGCCIEFDFTDYKDKFALYPVIYEERKTHNILKNLIIFTANALVRKFSENRVPCDISQLYAPFVTKDLIWSNQNEWRILGNANTKIPSPKISAIYLGCNVSEENVNKMKKRAIKFGFKLYKTFVKTNKNEFSFEEIIL